MVRLDPTFPTRNLFHGFLRTPDGTFTTFDAPGDVFGTFVTSINDLGVIAGYYEDPSFVNHGFFRASDGTITTFDPPGSLFTYVASINAAGTITGFYVGEVGFAHGFLRTSEGTYTTFDAPGSGKGVSGTAPQSIKRSKFEVRSWKGDDHLELA